MAVQFKDYYQTLGVARTASHDEIRKAFRQLARKHHPDVAKDKRAAEAKFKEINEAYEVLGDPEKRRKYDELGPDWEQAAAAGGGTWRGTPGGRAGADFGRGGGVSFGGTGFSDFFEQFFGGGRQTGGGGMGGFEQFAGAHARGSDIEADLLVTIEEALHGARKKISFRRDGDSRVETFEVRIPKGVREGQRIRLAGQGAAGGRGGAAGDLYLRVRFERHPDYRIDGSDLIYEVEIPAWKAVLGAELTIPTPDGSTRLKIPPASQPGRKFRLKDRGLPEAGGGRGDFYVELAVTLPSHVTTEQRELWEKIGQAWS
jgi:curved DNA-binding protein